MTQQVTTIHRESQDLEAAMTRLLKHWLKSYLNANDIDWSCRYPLTATGAIDRRKAESQGLNTTTSIRPIPTIRLGSDEYRELVAATELARRMVEPASDEHIGFELKRLSVWCPMPSRDVRDYKLMLHDALTDLAGFPHDLIQKACARYRNDPDPRCDFFPRPGRLKASIEGELRERKQRLYRLERLLAIANEPPKLPAPIPLAEIEAEAKHQIDVDKMLAQLTHKPVPEFSPEALVIEIKARTLAKIETYERDKHLTPEIATSYRQQLEVAHGQG